MQQERHPPHIFSIPEMNASGGIVDDSGLRNQITSKLPPPAAHPTHTYLESDSARSNGRATRCRIESLVRALDVIMSRSRCAVGGWRSLVLVQALAGDCCSQEEGRTSRNVVAAVLE